MSNIKVAVAVVLMVAGMAAGRQVENWPYERLFKEADLVVIAAAKEVRETEDAAPEAFKGGALGQVAVLEVKATLKGEAKGPRVEVLHFKHKDGSMQQNGAMLVRFRTAEIRIKTQSLSAIIGPPEYLVFLKAEKDGRYVPVTGQYDARLSVREVYAPIPRVIFGVETKDKQLQHE